MEINLTTNELRHIRAECKHRDRCDDCPVYYECDAIRIVSRSPHSWTDNDISGIMIMVERVNNKIKRKSKKQSQ